MKNLKISLKSNAKINIGLNIKEKLLSGYHLLDMTMLPISLFDELDIDFTGIKGELTIKSNIETIPVDENNILWKVYNSFYNFIKKDRDEIKIYLSKKIPFEAGLGGGSSNGAFFLKELNKYYGNILNDEKLIEIGKKIGADIPFFIKNCPVRVRGIGEELEKIENNLDIDIILIKPNFGVSTGKAYGFYKQLKNKKLNKDANIEEIINGLRNNNLEKVLNNCQNILEQGLLLYDENIKTFRKFLDENFDMKFFMSGSGSCYYTFCYKNEVKEKIETLKKGLNNCWIYHCSFL